jgi:thiol-disulfide isomerase/thioredoxin
LYGLEGATGWINSTPLTAKQLKGKVVLVDFWTYSCINCLRSLPYLRAWADKYKDSGLVVIGVHTPEFDFEKEQPKVQKAVQKFGITYPIALDGNWVDHAQVAVLKSASGMIVFHFHARDLHLVLGPTSDGKPVRFRMTIDGQAPGDNHGVDTDAQGDGVVTDHRLYQLVRQKGAVASHLFVIEFDDPGVQAFSFTFG